MRTLLLLLVLAGLLPAGFVPAGAQPARDIAYTELCDGKRPPDIANLPPAQRARFEEQIATNAELIEVACAQARLPRDPVHDTADANPAATHTKWNRAAHFTPDGSHIVSAGDDLTLRLWDVATGRQLRVIAQLPRRPFGLAMAPDGSKVAVSLDDGELRVIEIETGREALRLARFADHMLRPAAFDGAGRLVTLIDERTVGILPPDLQGAPLRLGAHPKPVYHLALSETARLAASADQAGSVRLWDLAGGKQIALVRLKNDTVDALAFSPDGAKLAISHSANVFVLDVATRQSSRVFASDWKLGMLDLAWTRDGKGLIAARRHLEMRSAETGARVRYFGPFDDLVHSVALSPDGKHAVTTHMGSDVRLWEVETGTFFRRFGRDVGTPR
jgi:WD40 repeat protein